MDTYKTEVFKTYKDFRKRADKNVNGVSAEFAESNPDYQEQNATNRGCWNCLGCSNCINCTGCTGCTGCAGCSYCAGCVDRLSRVPFL